MHIRKNTLTKKVTLALLSAFLAPQMVNAEDWTTPKVIEESMAKVAEWQIPRANKYHPTNWVYGAMYSGLAHYGRMNPTGVGMKAVRDVGSKTDWSLAMQKAHGYFADDHCIGHAWLELAMLDDSYVPLKNLKPIFDHIVVYQDKGPVDKRKKDNTDRWSWCDALFMAPPSLVKMTAFTGDEKYLKFMDKEFKACYDLLYDKEDKLFYRDARFIDQKSANGQKVFWSRGNGWVIGGLPLVLRDMPYDWKERPFYENLFKEMMTAFKETQAEDGSWHPSLRDAKDPDVKEMSGTLFIVYGMMWGINQGLLAEAEYLPVVQKAWKTVEGCLHEDGAIGFVQAIGDQPKNCNENSHEAYAPGAYLLAAMEIRNHLIAKAHKEAKTVEVKNPEMIFRPKETISVPWKDVKVDAQKLRVFDDRDGLVIPHQLMDNDGDGTPDELIFQADLAAKQARKFRIMASDTLAPADAQETCFSRPVPERMDDFAWENDRMAYRAYGPTLKQPAPKGEGLISGGVDVWCKKVKEPVINEFYASKAYHKDNGKGLDWYKVGMGPGCGGNLIVANKKELQPTNWKTAKTLATGPVRTVFQMTFDYDVDGKTVEETRTGTLDAGSSFTKFTSTFKCPEGVTLTVGPGIDISPEHGNEGQLSMDIPQGILMNWGKTNAENGTIGTAVVYPTTISETKSTPSGGLYLMAKATQPVTWYAGATWDKAGKNLSAQDWKREVETMAHKAQKPVEINVLP